MDTFGVRVRVEADTGDHLRQMLAVLPPGWRRAARGSVSARFEVRSPSAGPLELRRDGALLMAAPSVGAALELMERELRALVAQRSPNFVFVHAGVVAFGGGAIVIPGASFSGKSTLVAALVDAGATYYSDEFAVIDADARVRPFAKPLSLRPGGILQVDHTVEAPGIEPIRLDVVVLTTYRTGARWQPRELPPGEGAIVLMAHAIDGADGPAASLRAITRAAAGALVLEGERGEAEAVASQLLSRLSHARAAE